MSTLNLYASQLMQKYNASGATDVTGFGIKGHAEYLAQCQKGEVDIIIDKLPLIANMLQIEGKARNFRIEEGTSAETSGGLLLGISPDRVQQFRNELEAHG